MANHTPGPWTISNRQYIVAGDIGRTLYVAKVYGSGGENGCSWHDVDKANAALIARAPVLLDEIKWLEAENKELRQRPTFQKVQDLLLKIAQQQKEIQRLQAFEHVAKTL